MELAVKGRGPPAPFLRARDLFETAYDLELPVDVHIRPDPDERTWAGHYDDRHVLNISRPVASSAMAAELALHEFAHMRRYETGHPSHTQSTAEALFLAVPSRQIERRKVSHCYQIANHMKDIYADDLTFDVAPGDKLVSFLESEIAAAVADRPSPLPVGWTRRTRVSDPEVTAINAAFALALLERHDLLADDHPIYDLAHAAARDAPGVDLGEFKRRFAGLEAGIDERGFRRALVDVLRKYAVGPADPAAD